MDGRRITLPIGTVAMVCLTLLTGAGVYYKAMADIQGEMAKMRLEREAEFVRKDSFNSVAEKIEKIAEDVAEIKGRIRSR